MGVCKLSIIIVSYNTKDYLRKCLHSIHKDTSIDEFEIIVVDNNSKDGSPHMLRKEFPHVRLIENETNKGFAVANNQGFRLSNGTYIVLLNPDTEILSNSMTTLYEFMESHPEAGIAAPMLLNGDMSLQRSCRDFPSLWHDIVKGFGFPKFVPNHPVFGSVHLKGWDHDAVQEVSQPQGACMIVRRDALDVKDIFDDRFFMYYEEVDLCYRVRQNNYKIFFMPDARVIHYGGKSFTKNMPRMIYHMYRSKLLFYKKHFSVVQQAALYFFIPLEMIYRILVYTFIGFWQPRRRAEIRLRIKGYCRVLSIFVRGALSAV